MEPSKFDIRQREDQLIQKTLEIITLMELNPQEANLLLDIASSQYSIGIQTGGNEENISKKIEYLKKVRESDRKINITSMKLSPNKEKDIFSLTSKYSEFGKYVVSINLDIRYDRFSILNQLEEHKSKNL